MRNRPLCIILIAFLLGCEDDEPKISGTAENFLNEVIRTMEERSINRNSIDWTDFRTKVFEKAGAPGDYRSDEVVGR